MIYFRDAREAEGSGSVPQESSFLDNVDSENTISDINKISDYEMIDNEITEIHADEPSADVKPQNIPKCIKCLKNSFRFRHDGFCGKCVTQVC